jgi:asparagine synthase (glutamine-hydrolysing)
MCGIAGIVNLSNRHAPPSKELLSSMIGTLRHRGPDEFGNYRDAHAGLAHARLSIIDLATGQQPLTNEKGTLWIVFNGEIFNYVELREQLRSLGHTFRTQSDTEVIVHAYEAWGHDCFSKFNGQWAVALWDNVNRTLILSRDRVGVRPLYVARRSGRLWFGSEVKAIFADPEFPRAIDPKGLDQVFTYWSPIAPTTVFEGIEEVRAGSTRIYSGDQPPREFQYWQPSFPEDESGYCRLTLGEATEALREMLARATSLRMLRSDVPVGSYLSGGLDSSLIAWMGRQAKQGEFRTFSLRFEDAEFDETEYQRAMAATIDSNHREVVVKKRDIATVFPDVIRHAERPVLRTAPAPMFLLSRLVRQSGIKAVLTGEGADEMLAGYDLFKEAKIRQFWSHQPNSTARPALFDRLYPYLARSPQQTKGMAIAFWRQGLERAGTPGYSHQPRWSTTSQLKKFFGKEVTSAIDADPAADFLGSLPSNFGRWDSLGQAQYLEDVTLLSGYLLSSQGDRMLMANSVEGRFPFLDSEVMEFCNSLPPSFKLTGLNEKFILKKVAAGAVPEIILKRSKQPYRAPDAASFFCDDAPEYVKDLLSESSVKKVGIFNPEAVGALVSKSAGRLKSGNEAALLSNTDNMAFVGILSTQLLHSELLEKNYGLDGQTVKYVTEIDKVKESTYST